MSNAYIECKHIAVRYINGFVPLQKSTLAGYNAKNRVVGRCPAWFHAGQRLFVVMQILLQAVQEAEKRSESGYGFRPFVVPLTGLGPVRFLRRGIFTLLYVAIAVKIDVVVRTFSLP